MDLKSATYIDLLLWSCPEPVTRGNYKRLLAKLDLLMMEGTRPKGALRKIISLLAPLLEEYELRKHPPVSVSGREALAYIVEQRGESRSEFARAMGIRPQVVSNVLNGKRGISKKLAARLGEKLKLDAVVFLVADLKE